MLKKATEGGRGGEHQKLRARPLPTKTWRASVPPATIGLVGMCPLGALVPKMEIPFF